MTTTQAPPPDSNLSAVRTRMENVDVGVSECLHP